MQDKENIAELKRIIERQKTVINSLERSLTDSERTIRSIVSRLPLGFIVLNQDFKIEAANNRVVELFEYSTQELSNSTIDNIYPGIGPIDELPPNAELKAYTKSNKQKMTTVSVNCVRLGNQSRYFFHIQDTTEQYRLEQLKRDFVSMLSHDLRSPISNLQILLTMLADGDFGKLEAEGTKRVVNARNSTEQLVKMVSELLDLEKMEEGLFSLNKIECSLSSIVDGAIDDVYELCESKDLEVESSLGDYNINCDKDQVRRVVVNLLTNAIKFAPRDSKVAIKVEQENKALTVSIADQGPGISEEKQETIFDRYKQADSEQSVGSGLGLAICKAIVEAHSGNINVSSEIGKGSIFSFSLPIGLET